MKLIVIAVKVVGMIQPPSGGCVLKHVGKTQLMMADSDQPPSGGCVLKLGKAFKDVNQRPSRLQAAVC